MAKNVQLAFEESGPKRLQLEIATRHAGLVARVDGNVVLQFPSRDALVAGGQVVLDDGSTLAIRFVPSFSAPALEVLRNGYPVPGSDTHPGSRIRTAAWAFLVIAAFTAIAGLVRASSDAAPAGEGIGMVLEGVVFGVVGGLTWRRTRWAFLGGVGLYTIESVFQLVGLVTAGTSYAAGGLVGFVLWRTVFYGIFWRAFVAFRDLGRTDPNAVSAAFR